MSETEKTYEFPTEVITLPSEGKLYPETHPLSKGIVTLKYMTAKEEDILASQNLIRKGIVLDKLLESVLIDVPLDDLFIGDKNAVLLATRILGYGPEYRVEVTDPKTFEKSTVSIDLSKVKTKDIDFSKVNRKNEYTFKLPLSGKELKFKLLTHKDEKEIAEETAALEKLNKNSSPAEITMRLRKMILSVDGKTDRAFINKWVTNEFFVKDTRAFRAYISEISPDLDLKFEYTSPFTGDTEALNIPFGINFFYPSV